MVAAVVVAVLEGDEAEAVGCTMSDEAGRPAVDATTLELEELPTVGWTTLSAGGRPPVEATVASLAVVTVLEADELGAVGCTISEEGGRPPVEATTVGAAAVCSLTDVSAEVLEEGGAVGPPGVVVFRADGAANVFEVVDSVVSLLAVVLSDIA